ncbi:hypothetical protein C8Q76DRAFT_238853 [Earliella scabrosa]|nr:hypothetical protein C8Q76DRAFT_238853 [Earliella scabrosa]
MAHTTPASDICLRLQDPDDFVVLVSCPTVRIKELEEVGAANLCGFTKKYVAMITDGTNTMPVVLPEDVVVFGVGDGVTVRPGDDIKIQRMLRLPDPATNASVILVHEVLVVLRAEHAMSASEDAIIGSPPLLYSTLQGHDLQGKINELEAKVTALEAQLADRDVVIRDQLSDDVKDSNINSVVAMLRMADDLRAKATAEASTDAMTE